jgi:ligand-binding sensor domain-containing protein
MDMIYSMNRQLALFFLSFLIITASAQEINFNRISIEQGLASSRVHQILEDRQGFMWFATDNGLHKYDGYKFVIYRPEEDNPFSISNVFCISLLEDFKGNIWIGTFGGGLNKFNPEKQRFTRFIHQDSDSLSLGNNYVMSLSISKIDTGYALWMGTRSGLSKLDLESNTFERYFVNEDNSNDKKYNLRTYSYVDDDGIIWVGTDNGLYKYDHKKDNFSKFLPISGIRKILKDRSGFLWIAPFKGGLYRVDLINKRSEYFQFHKDDPFALSDTYVSAIFEDDQENLWIGTFNGLNLLNKPEKTFTQIYNRPNDPTSLSHNYIVEIYQKENSPLWISTLKGGINTYTPNSNRFANYRLSSKYKNVSGFESVNCIYTDPSDKANILWIGSSGGGIFRYDIDSKKLKQFYDTLNKKSNFIRSIHPDPTNKNRLLIGTWGAGIHLFDKDRRIFPNPVIEPGPEHIYSIQKSNSGIVFIGSGSGLYIYDPRNKGSFQFRRIENLIDYKYITVIFEERPGRLWLGTYGQGLIRLHYSFDSEGNIETKFKCYSYEANNISSLSNNTITCIYIDKHNSLWIGTKGGGLNQYNPNNDNFNRITEKDGLPSNIIHAILEDDRGNLWISTQSGLLNFDPIDLNLRIYDKYDGLLSDEFNSRSASKDKAGNMYFGNSRGLTIFHPDKLVDNLNIPPVVLTDFQIFNKPIIPGDNSPIKKSISLADTILLKYDQNIFSFEFASLDFIAPEKNKFHYKMEGIDPDWVSTDASRRFATYTHLDPGEYIFSVKGSNNDGIWNEESTSIRIIISPPWWRTKFAYFFYILFTVGLILFVRWYELNRQRLKHNLDLEHVGIQ